VSAYLALVDYGRKNEFHLETFELGTGQAIQVCDFVKKVKSYLVVVPSWGLVTSNIGRMKSCTRLLISVNLSNLAGRR
jgi:hypothetical protein